MSLKDWEKNGWLRPHSTNRQEIQNLLEIVERDLQDSKVGEISFDWRFSMAYNAALQCCTIALYCCGYKPARGLSEHYRVIQSLPYTMGDKFIELRDYFNSCRTKRNIADYDTAGIVSRSEAAELIDTAEDFLQDVKNWIAKNYSTYL